MEEHASPAVKTSNPSLSPRGADAPSVAYGLGVRIPAAGPARFRLYSHSGRSRRGPQKTARTSSRASAEPRQPPDPTATAYPRPRDHRARPPPEQTAIAKGDTRHQTLAHPVPGSARKRSPTPARDAECRFVAHAAASERLLLRALAALKQQPDHGRRRSPGPRWFVKAPVSSNRLDVPLSEAPPPTASKPVGQSDSCEELSARVPIDRLDSSLTYSAGKRPVPTQED